MTCRTLSLRLTLIRRVRLVSLIFRSLAARNGYSSKLLWLLYPVLLVVAVSLPYTVMVKSLALVTRVAGGLRAANRTTASPPLTTFNAPGPVPRWAPKRNSPSRTRNT